MPKPQSDNRDVNARLQEMHSCCMAKRMGTDLVQKESSGLISVPWDSIVINLSNTAVA